MLKLKKNKTRGPFGADFDPPSLGRAALPSFVEDLWLAVLGLASNVLQFVDFVLKLNSTGTEVAGSLNGASERILEIEKVYSSLDNFSSKLNVKGIRTTYKESTKSLLDFYRALAYV
jgi:hypothetical protein